MCTPQRGWPLREVCQMMTDDLAESRRELTRPDLVLGSIFSESGSENGPLPRENGRGVCWCLVNVAAKIISVSGGNKQTGITG